MDFCWQIYKCIYSAAVESHWLTATIYCRTPNLAQCTGRREVLLRVLSENFHIDASLSLFCSIFINWQSAGPYISWSKPCPRFTLLHIFDSASTCRHKLIRTFFQAIHKLQFQFDLSIMTDRSKLANWRHFGKVIPGPPQHFQTVISHKAKVSWTQERHFNLSLTFLYITFFSLDGKFSRLPPSAFQRKSSRTACGHNLIRTLFVQDILKFLLIVINDILDYPLNKWKRGFWHSSDQLTQIRAHFTFKL